ncbi:WD40 repeat domain-containing protein [Micromonospora sp. WMMD1102]|uniref:WD40 repeat domain-containing protein n=1 Tax=Micromonospora sp. WMMD1102 TaxID=3016105 RepID=UPI002415627D|nr:WD40 repeat domain-containing protein [Micromonospora sp. WMMD1102]MDG4791333.1 WD40 repeat domain-containing protein [Micromonospora sp. WMMD1102]
MVIAARHPIGTGPGYAAPKLGLAGLSQHNDRFLPVTPIDMTLTFPDPARPKFYRIRLDGRRLIRTAWTEGRKPRETVKYLDVSYDHEAEWACWKVRDKMMREGFCRVADVAGAARGDTVLEFLVPNRSSGDVFDLSPDGRTLVVGTMLKEAYGAEIHLVDIATGHRRLLHTEPPETRPEPLGKAQTFIHTVFFDADGERIIYALNEETRLLDPASGQQRTLAAYRQYQDAQFNPFCVQPVWDAARRRLLVFDAGDMVRVIDTDGSVLFEVCTKAGTTECRAGALSPSGRLLALYRPSRGVVYRHEDALHDPTNEIEVWDIAAGRLTARIPAPVPPAGARQLHKIGFDPTESLVVTNPDPVQGPCALSIETGELVWHFPDAYRTDRWDTCYGWDYSPDGATLAIGRRGDTEVVDAATRVADSAFERCPATGPTGRTYRVKLAADGTLLASGGDSGRILVRKL